MVEVVLTAHGVMETSASLALVQCNAMGNRTPFSELYLSQHINQETLLHVERMEIGSEFVIVALQLTRVAPLPHEIVFCSRPKLAVFTSMGISLHKQLDCRVLGRNTNPEIRFKLPAAPKSSLNVSHTKNA